MRMKRVQVTAKSIIMSHRSAMIMARRRKRMRKRVKTKRKRKKMLRMKKIRRVRTDNPEANKKSMRRTLCQNSS